MELVNYLVSFLVILNLECVERYLHETADWQLHILVLRNRGKFNLIFSLIKAFDLFESKLILK
jgi:hypothetical protein